MQPGAGARLVPGIAGPAWDLGVAVRVVLWRELGGVRFARVESGGGGPPVGFVVTARGLEAAAALADDGDGGGLRSRKRKRGEVLGSADEGEGDEDYGWAEEDAGELPPLPPQTQGSEDVLVVPGEQEEEEWSGEGEGEDEDEDGRERGEWGDVLTEDETAWNVMVRKEREGREITFADIQRSADATGMDDEVEIPDV